MVSVLVTGGLGFIGSHVVVELLNLNYDIIIIDNLSNSSIDVLNKIKEITNKNPYFYNMDLLSSNLEDIMTENKFEYVIHLAGLKAVNESISFPIKYYDINLNSTLNLLKCMEKHGCYNLIFSSSATVYGSAPIPLTESSTVGIGITNPYGQTKFMIERILADLSKSNEKWKIVTLRYFNPIGAHSSGLLGESPKDKPNNLMPYVLRVADERMKDYPKLTIFGNDYNTIDGSPERDFIHVVDLAISHTKAINYIDKMKGGFKPFNIGTGESVSVLQLIKTFQKINNVDLKWEIGSRRDGDLSLIYCKNELAKDKLEWEPTKTLDDMCRDAWNFQINQNY